MGPRTEMRRGAEPCNEPSRDGYAVRRPLLHTAEAGSEDGPSEAFLT